MEGPFITTTLYYIPFLDPWISKTYSKRSIKGVSKSFPRMRQDFATRFILKGAWQLFFPTTNSQKTQLLSLLELESDVAYNQGRALLQNSLNRLF